jgi:alcohol dehydrogenase
MKQHNYIGQNSISNLTDILVENKVDNVFLVTGNSSYVRSGAEKALKSILEPYNVTRFYDFDVNPKLEDVEKGIEIIKKNKCDIVIAIGGGSVIDMAKLINILVENCGDPSDYIKNGKKISYDGKPLVAIPTTSGSGSETTHFAVVYINKIKYSLAHENILPNYSIVDPEFTKSLPKDIVAASGMDALGQAIEAHWSINSTKESKEYSSRAIRLLVTNLVNQVNNPTDESRLAVAEASYLAGKSINIAKTTAPHAISYTLTTYFDIPHGHAVGLTLGDFLEYNSNALEDDINDSRGLDYIKETISEICDLLNVDNANQAKQKLKEIMSNIGLETNLTKLGIRTEEHIKLILDNVNLERMNNNPRKVTSDYLRSLF